MHYIVKEFFVNFEIFLKIIVSLYNCLFLLIIIIIYVTSIV